MKKEFKVRMNTATVIYLCACLAYTVLTFFTEDTSTFITICIFAFVSFTFFLGFRPYKYTIDKKILTIHYRLWKNTEVNLMECETICDPVSRWADIATRPHAIEIYTDVKKRYCFFPVGRVDFVGTILQANKRIHCTVKDYTDVHRQLEKKLRKEKRKAEKAAAKKQIEMESED